MEPPPSEACAAGTRPAATAAAAPPDEPPVERSRFQGLWQGPRRKLSVVASNPNSGVFVLPTMTSPASMAFCGIGSLAIAKRVEAETRARRGALAGHIVQVLDEIGHARERTFRQRAFGAGAGVFEHLPYDGIEFRIGRLNAGDRGVDEIKRRRLLRTHELRLADAVVTRKGVMRGRAFRAQPAPASAEAAASP